ncbi:hypothetical protein ACHAXN_005125 [Cyclotella atomus]
MIAGRKTSYLLCNPRSGGYDVIDHAFGSAFTSDLMNELQSNGWLDRLQKARTKMDVDLEQLMSLSLGSAFIDAVSAGSSEQNARGDESVFISRDIRSNPSFQQDHPTLHRLIKSIEETAINCLPDEIQLNTDLTSVQLARYPGDGCSAYSRHCDSGVSCRSEQDINSSNTASNGRVLTFVYYLTPHDWDAELDGGALRVFSSINENEDAFDIMPFSDRLVVFRSDYVEHQVLPSLRRERIAITVWLYEKDGRVASNTVPQTDFGDHVTICDRSNLPPPLPMPKSTTQAVVNDTIFVAIPSYRDSETWPTILSILQTAHNPERVSIGVVWQVDMSSMEEMRMVTAGVDCLNQIKETYDGLPFKWNTHNNLRTLIMDYRQATGPCYARHLGQSLHRGEEFVLQIDSHMRFRPRWDVYLISQWKKCGEPASTISSKIGDEVDRPRVVLTTYPPNYDASHGPGPDAETRAILLVPWKFGPDNMLRQKGRLISSTALSDNQTQENDNIPCLLFAGGFNFFQSSLLDDCPYDKLHGLFFGEEISMAVRLYTHGYNLFSPPQTVCYHKWERNPLRTREYLFESYREASLKVVKMQLQGIEGVGLGTRRSASQFSEELGVDFAQCKIGQGCENDVRGADFACTEIKQVEHFISNDISQVLELVTQFIS